MSILRTVESVKRQINRLSFEDNAHDERTERRTDGRTNRRTDGQAEREGVNIVNWNASVIHNLLPVTRLSQQNYDRLPHQHAFIHSMTNVVSKL